MKLALATAVVFLGLVGLSIPSVAGAANGVMSANGPMSTDGPTGTSGPTGAPGPILGGCHPIAAPGPTGASGASGPTGVGPTGVGATGASGPHIICYDMMSGGVRPTDRGIPATGAAASMAPGTSTGWWFAIGAAGALALVATVLTHRKLAESSPESTP